jgi:cytochrome P450
MAFMAFGQGPRNCVGSRFALMQIKLCLTRILQQYYILPSEKTEKEFIIRETLVIIPNSIYIKLEKRKKT